MRHGGNFLAILAPACLGILLVGAGLTLEPPGPSAAQPVTFFAANESGAFSLIEDRKNVATPRLSPNWHRLGAKSFRLARNRSLEAIHATSRRANQRKVSRGIDLD